MSTQQDPLGPLRGHPFIIMDGAGNDFVIADLRNGGFMTEAAAIELGDREGMWGADQIIALRQKGGKPLMEIRNTDGSVAGACGNASPLHTLPPKQFREERVGKEMRRPLEPKWRCVWAW